MSRGVVSVYFSRQGGPLYAHERSALAAVARAIAEVKHLKFVECEDKAPPPSNRFLVPDDTLILDEALELDINCPDDFFGGVVPHPFVKTKAITHALVDSRATRPEGWSTDFVQRVQHVVLPGYTVFSTSDARIAARRLLNRGAIRIKEPRAAGGIGQTLVHTVAGLEAFLEKFCSDDIADHGLVLEANLSRVTTLSVGQITVEGIAVRKE
jgi:hypothetical protein